ncbi:MAG: hypothetical protein WCK77_15805 [Verrucomicrobiota bacterium]
MSFRSGPWSGVWQISHSGLASLQITAALDSTTATLIQGRMSLNQWNGLQWQNLTTGTSSLTK